MRSLNTMENINLGAEAIVKEWSEYEDRRRELSQEIFGHPGAHIGNLPMPTPTTLAAAVLSAVQERMGV